MHRFFYTDCSECTLDREYAGEIEFPPDLFGMTDVNKKPGMPQPVSAQLRHGKLQRTSLVGKGLHQGGIYRIKVHSSFGRNAHKFRAYAGVSESRVT